MTNTRKTNNVTRLTMFTVLMVSAIFLFALPGFARHGGGPGRGFGGPGMGPGGPGMGAGGPGMGPGMGGFAWWNNPEIASQINLTDQQQDRIDEVALEGRLKLTELRANVQRENIILQNMLRADNFNAARAKAQVDKVAAAHAELHKAQLNIRIDIMNVLTQEQREQIPDIRRGRGPCNVPQRGR